jgi:ribosome-associated translation inhibitor RaiA
MQIHWVHLSDLNPEVRDAIEARLQRLADERDDLIEVQISAQRTNHHHHGGRSVRITCLARGRQIVVSSERPDVGLALNEALDAFEREVHEQRRKRKDARRSARTGA